MRILIFDKEEDNQYFYTQLCGQAHITFDLIFDFQEFFKKKYEDYLAVLVRGDFNDELFRTEVRTQVIERSILIAFSELPLSIDQLRLLQETQKIPFVLHTSIENYELKGIIALCQKKEEAGNDPFSDIREQFKSTIYTKLTRIQDKIGEISQSLSDEALYSLQKQIEPLAKSAAAHNYFIVSYLCWSVHQEIRKAIAYASYLRDDLRQILGQFLRKLEVGFQLCGIGKGMELEILENIHQLDSTNLDICLFDKIGERNEIEKRALGCGLNLIAISPDEALASKIVRRSKIGLLRQKEEEKTSHFLKRLREIQQNWETLAWGVVDFRGGLEERLEAMQAGVTFFSDKTMTSQSLVEALNSELRSLAKKRGAKLIVFILSRAGLLGLIQSSLAGLDCEITHFTDRKALFEEMQKHRPDFVILEEYPSKPGSVRLMKMVHGDFHFKDIPILIVIDLEDLSTIEESHFDDNEDWLAHPFSIPLFISKVTPSLRRQSMLRYYKDHDPDTQAYSIAKFRESFQFAASYYVFALIEIDREQIVTHYGREKYDETFTQIGCSLKNIFSLNEWIVAWNEKQFVLIFEDQEEQVDFFLQAFIQRVSKTFAKTENLEIGIYYALASYMREGKDLNELYFVASEKISKIHSKHAAQIIEQPKKDEVLLIDPDASLLELVGKSLRLRSFRTQVATTGNGALDILKNCIPSQLPSLIILERILEDMDGIEMISKVKKMFPHNSCQFWFLSVRSSDQDIMEGLKAGAQDYVAKPFNLTLLTEKVSKVLTTQAST